MKKFLTALFAGAILLPAVLSAASFEGSLRMKMTSGKEKPVEMDYLIKNNKARITPQLGQKKDEISMIYDYDKMEMITLMPSEKMYMTMSLKSAVEAASNNKSGEKFELRKTGEKEKILGYNCEKYLMTSADTNMEMWLTDELGAYMGMSSAMSGGRGRGGQTPQAQAWEKALEGKNLFPMHMVGLDTKGKENFRMEVSAIEKKSVADAELAPPAGFQKFEMPSAGDMMKGMLKGMIPGR
jgi:hypothetical protein